MAATRFRTLRERASAWVSAAAACVLLLQGCATPPRAAAGPSIAGRIAVRSEAAPGRDARSASGEFELSGSPARGQLVLTSPIGTVVARAQWTTGESAAANASAPDIELEADGRTRHFDGFEDMTEAALGERLPLAAMFDWLAGRPWPRVPAAWDPDRGAFQQLGWRVDRSHYEADGLVTADRALPPPALHVRVKLDRDAAGSPSPAASSASAAP